MPCYSYGQKLSKLAILRIACNYILSLARLADLDYSADRSNLSFSECVQRCTRTLQAEGRAKKRKVRAVTWTAASGRGQGRGDRSLGCPHSLAQESQGPVRSPSWSFAGVAPASELLTALGLARDPAPGNGLLGTLRSHPGPPGLRLLIPEMRTICL